MKRKASLQLIFTKELVTKKIIQRQIKKKTTVKTISNTKNKNSKSDIIHDDWSATKLDESDEIDCEYP